MNVDLIQKAGSESLQQELQMIKNGFFKNEISVEGIDYNTAAEHWTFFVYDMSSEAIEWFFKRGFAIKNFGKTESGRIHVTMENITQYGLQRIIESIEQFDERGMCVLCSELGNGMTDEKIFCSPSCEEEYFKN